MDELEEGEIGISASAYIYFKPNNFPNSGLPGDKVLAAAHSCSSENLESSSYDRRCIRCLIHEMENGTDGDTVPTKGTFTRSFSVESALSFAELFKKSEEDFGGEGTQVLFCKALDVTSDEDDERKGLKRTYEDRRERRKGERYKRLCSSDDCGERLRPSSKCSVRSESRRAPKKLSEQPATLKKQKSRPSFNRSQPSSNPPRVTETKNSRKKPKNSKEPPTQKDSSKVSVRKNKQRVEKSDEVTIYEKTIITVTSSDNYLMGDPMNPLYKYKSDVSKKLSKAVSNQIKSEGFVPASIGVYGANNSALRKGLMKRDVSLNRMNDVQILPVIQELSMQDDAISRPKTRSSASTESECRDKVIRPQKSITMRGNTGKVENKSLLQGVHSTLFPNSCLKKETQKTNSSKKSVRFMVSDSQSNLGGEKVPKKSLRLEKFPSGLSVKTPSGNEVMSNFTAAPVVVRIQNTTMDCVGSLGGDGMNNIIHRETAQRMIQEQLINSMGFIRNINAQHGQSMTLLKSPSEIPSPGSPFQFSIEGFNQSLMGPHFRAISLQRLGVENGSTEIQYTLSDLGIPRKKMGKGAQDMIRKSNYELVPAGMKVMEGPKTNSLEERRKHIRLKLSEPYSKNNVTSSDTREVSGAGAIALNDRKIKTENSNAMKPRSGRAGTMKTLINKRAISGNAVGEVDTCQKSGDLSPHVRRDKPQGTTSNKSPNRGVTRREVIKTRRANEVQAKKDDVKTDGGGSEPIGSKSRPATAGSKSIASRDNSPMSVINTMNGALRPKSQEVRHSSPGGFRSRGISVHVEGGMSPDGSHSRRSSLSPNRPPSRKPHLNGVGRVNDSSARPPEKSHGAPRTPLTLRPKTQPDLKTSSTIRQHLRSSGVKTSAPANKILEPTRKEMNASTKLTKKLSGHPLRNKTLSEFLEERKTGAANKKKKNVS